MTHPRAEYLREYHLKNKEKRNARSKEHYYNNVEEIREQKKRYYQKHREEYSTRQKEKRRENKIKCIEYLGGKCMKCGTTDRLEFDHIDRTTKKYVIASRVNNKWDNLKEELDKCQLLCVDCHLQKTAKEWADITYNTVPLSKLNTMP